MGGEIVHGAGFWELVARQHGVVSRSQLFELGWSAKAIEHAVRRGALHRLWRGVFAVGRPEVSREGRWCAALLACGPAAALSHGTGAALWRLGELERGVIEVSIPGNLRREHAGIRAHRSHTLTNADLTRHRGLLVTTPARTIIDLVPRLSKRGVERLVNEAANLDLVTPPALRRDLEGRGRQPGMARLRAVLDRRSFRLTRSELERHFLPIARRAGLGVPETRVWLDGFEVDFYFRDLDLVVETDGLRFHRTPAQQARDRLRDQAHAVAGRTSLRFTHEQVRHDPRYVESTMRRVADRIRARS